MGADVRQLLTGAHCVCAKPGRKREAPPGAFQRQLEKTLTAPVTAIVAWDSEFYERLPELFPHGDARSWFTASPALAEETAFRNSSMQAAYLIFACRALGLDTGPMSGLTGKKWTRPFSRARCSKAIC